VHKKVHKYNAIIRSITLLALVSTVIATHSCHQKSPKKKEEIQAQDQNPTMQYNIELGEMLFQAWQRDGVTVDELGNIPIEKLQAMIAVVQHARELIEDAKLENIDPILEKFFAKQGTKETLIPEVAFKKLLPVIPADADEAFKQYAQLFVQEKIKLFEASFEKCKNNFSSKEKTLC